MTKSLLWGLFCACSWTWCIGMFLPFIMLDRYGMPGFFVFAIPNVLGCAGFGYLFSRESSRACVEKHTGAMRAFSAVAIAFQLFFVTFLFSRMYVVYVPTLPAPINALLPTAAALLVYIAGAVLARLGDRGWLAGTVVVYAISVGAMFAVGTRAGATLADLSGPHGAAALAWLAPVVAIGFFLCPALDLTFHRARQTAPSRHAFAVFGVSFTLLICFTPFVWYHPEGILLAAVAHVIAQITFTIGAHLRELRTVVPERPLVPPALVRLAPLLGLLALPAADLVLATESIGRDTYLRFMVFYGLVFPAYALTFIGPGRALPLTKSMLVRVGAVTLLMLPVMELGFLHAREWLLVIPAALAAAWWIARIPRVPPATAPVAGRSR